MMEVRWSQQALSDLVEIGRWLNERNPKAAKRAEQEIGVAISSIAKRPLAWPKARGHDAHVRSLPKWTRRIVYRVGPDFILIISMKHTRQESNI
ncbi:type II toxin-antitoxin system RelE/ParE family toxin [Candidatus Phycosocius spiralis]|uniref:type II toxin-antitoxin system RelE/ParE family toxin n=1 Tax=Candidatus Phycosocius spiralis TaxID=2815099 RepID=UPI003B9685A1